MPGVERPSPGDPHASAASPSSSETGSLNLRWAGRFASALADAGVRDVVIAPGSRSAPIAVAFHRSSIRTHIALDERAGAYFALGLAKAARRPAAVLCTSGTAAANFHPAILEAHHGRVPLIALTADRPPELRDTGAPQTIDQLKLYGGAVRAFFDAGPPAPGPEMDRFVTSLAHRAVAAAWGPPAGPVHLNFEFREPLLPPPGQHDASRAEAPSIRADVDGDDVDRVEEHGGPPPSPRAIERMARFLRGRKRGLIVCGPTSPMELGANFAPALAALATATGYPILADPLSGVRFGPHDQSRALAAYDVFLRVPAFTKLAEPEVVLHFGMAPTSKALARFLAPCTRSAHVAVDAAGLARDPNRMAERVERAAPALFARALAASLERGSEPLPSWGDLFARAESAARGAIERRWREDQDAITEAGLFPALLGAMPAGSILFAGNSMPVRDLDSFTSGSERNVHIAGNRGVNGIDGVVSTALGMSAGSDAPVLLVIGDLSFHHDLNALAAIREGRARAVIVIVNNDGGGIFSFLPASEHTDLFERYFGTPHGLDFEAAARLYAVPYARPAGLRELVERAGQALRSKESLVIEVRTDRRGNVAHHRALLAEAAAAVEAAL
jgi:2-succinyl-5-enolpyruvyl-6-hydroxy-3-cyclohexene-1-carboxylate synthase